MFWVKIVGCYETSWNKLRTLELQVSVKEKKRCIKKVKTTFFEDEMCAAEPHHLSEGLHGGIFYMLPLLADPVGFIWNHHRDDELHQEQNVLKTQNNSYHTWSDGDRLFVSYLNYDGHQEKVAAAQPVLLPPHLDVWRQQQQPAVGHDRDKTQDLKGNLEHRTFSFKTVSQTRNFTVFCGVLR